MRRIVYSVLVLALAVGLAGFLFMDAGAEAPAKYRMAKVEEGAITSVVSTTGTLNAVTTVLVGSQLSGQVKELLADFNTEVKAGQVIARIDSDMIQARLKQAEADLESARAGVLQQTASLQRAKADVESARAAVASARAQVVRSESAAKDAERDYARRTDLLAKGVATQADTDKALATLEQAKAQLLTSRAQVDAAVAALGAAEALVRVAEAQVQAAHAQISQRTAALAQVRVDLDHSEIRAPIDGVVVQRSVDVGQTVAASLQAPTLFTIAQDLSEMEVGASVDESDIGRVREGQQVTFTVTAYPADSFAGTVKQIRLAPQVVQNVVTYIVVIAAENAQRKLLPGMTATARIVSDSRDKAIKVPNVALRWRPPGTPAEGAPQGTGGVLGVPGGAGGQQGGRGWANLDTMAKTLTEELKLSGDQQKQLAELIEGARRQFGELADAKLEPDQRRARAQAIRRTTTDRVTAILDQTQRARYRDLQATRITGSVPGQVWIIGNDGKPQAVAVRLGIGDGAYTELVGGNLKPGQDVIIGGGPKAASNAPASPFRFGL